jgi:GT2 family glycosyltransferase
MDLKMASPDIEVSVIIVNWNTCEVLRNCLQSVVDETKAGHEIIVIDNASTDRSVQMVRAAFPQVVLIANNRNLGFAGANNQGLAVAKGRHVLLLNPDTLILEGAIDKSLAWLREHPDVGCMGCQVLEGPGVIQNTCFADPSLKNQIIVDFGLMRLSGLIPAFGGPWYRDWDRRSEREVDVVSGMFMLVPRAVLDRVGPLDDAFFIYAEEADWCRRIRKAGWRCVFAPVGQIIHLDGGSKSTAQIRSKMYVQMQKSQLIYARKHDGVLGYAVAKSLLVVASLMRFGVFGAMSLARPSEERRARVRLAGAALSYHLTGREPIR